MKRFSEGCSGVSQRSLFHTSLHEALGESDFAFYTQKSQIYTWDGRQSDRWTKLDLKTELPRDTLLSVEIVHELKGEVGSYSLLQSSCKYNVQLHLFFVRYCRMNVPCVIGESLLHLLFRETILG